MTVASGLNVARLSAGGLAALCILGLSCASLGGRTGHAPPPDLPVLSADSPERCSFAVGQRFAVRSFDNPSTGYEPLFTIYPYPQVIDLGRDKGEELMAHRQSPTIALVEEIDGPAPDKELVGAGRDLWYVFEARSPGRVRLLAFFRKWNGEFSMDGGQLYDVEVTGKP